MCMGLVTNLLKGDIGGAVSAEANAWGMGGASAKSHACGGKGASIHKYGAGEIDRSGRYEAGSRRYEAGLKSHSGKCESGHGNGSFEKTTTQTRVGADGSVTQKTTHTSSSGGYGHTGYDASGYGRFGAGSAYLASGHGDNRFGQSGFGDVARSLHSERASGASGSFAFASASIAPVGPFAFLANIFGGNQQAA
jgi:hypothetical protein